MTLGKRLLPFRGRFGFACVRFVRVHLLHNAALIFDATFQVLALSRHVVNRFACLVTHVSMEIADCGVG